MERNENRVNRLTASKRLKATAERSFIAHFRDATPTSNVNFTTTRESGVCDGGKVSFPIYF